MRLEARSLIPSPNLENLANCGRHQMHCQSALFPPDKPQRKTATMSTTANGDSMATTHVTGGCALYLSSHLDALPWEIKDAILGNTIPTSSLSGKTVTGGRLNVGGF